MKIVVVGDVLLDVDLDGTATRLCPDAPVPVVDIATVSARAGGAGLVARMLANDGHQVCLVTALGSDAPGRRLREELQGITVVAGPSGAPTPVKTRLRAGGHPVARFDEGCRGRPEPGVTAEMLQAVEEARALVVADYGRGLTSHPGLRAMIGRLARSVPVIWDPHPAGADPVPGVAVVTPNHFEARTAAAAVAPDGRAPSAGAAGVAAALLKHWQSNAVLVTQGGEGATLVHASSTTPVRLPAPPTTVADSCGAGDRLAASGKPLRSWHAAASPPCERPPNRGRSRVKRPMRWTWSAGYGHSAAPSWPREDASICCTPGTPVLLEQPEAWGTASSSA
jgi:D-beta-D-heptose 7-phosphate kinase/D-beta-D-heptose 1-phosphate adenosyltransferase